MKIKNIINKIKEKNEELAYKRKTRMAKAKGFSTYESYEIQTAIARKEACDKANSDLRKQEIKRVQQEEYDKIKSPQGTIQKLNKGITKFNKSMAQFSTVVNAADEKPARKSKRKYKTATNYPREDRLPKVNYPEFFDDKAQAKAIKDLFG